MPKRDPVAMTTWAAYVLLLAGLVALAVNHIYAVSFGR